MYHVQASFLIVYLVLIQLFAQHANKDINFLIIKIFIVITFFLTPLSAKDDYLIENQPIALEKISEITAKGKLKQKENGFVYLDVSNEYIDALKPILEVPGTLNYLPTAKRSLGAHITVFVENDAVTPEELGQEFSFNVSDIRSFTQHTRDGLKKLWAIAVESPELEILREQYRHSPKLKGHAFHITLGKQLPAATEGWKNIDVISPLNNEGESTLGLDTKGDFVRVESKEIKEIAKRINNVAQLYLKQNGFAYLNVDDAFVDEIAPLVPAGISLEPISTGGKKMGAHISVFYEDEMIGKQIWNPQEIGQWFAFEAKELRYVDRKTPKGKQRIWFIAVDAPGLERLRKNYGLKPKLQGHDFHITIGYENLEENQTNSDIEERQLIPEAA